MVIEARDHSAIVNNVHRHQHVSRMEDGCLESFTGL